MNFSQTLITWYNKNNRELPWRTTKNPYKIWLSEIMLQQTRVAQGLPYYLKFIKAFPTVFDLAEAKEEQVLKLWQGLGYYSRARNLHFTAKYIAEQSNGIFPKNYANLLKLKGVGDYTASAIASICYNEPVAVVDGNVYRVLARYFGIKTAINSSGGIKEFKALAQTLINPKKSGTHNQAIMDFGALLCKPKNPLCNECPLENSCVSLQNNWIHQLPVKEKKTKIKTLYFNYLIAISSDKKTILEQRTSKGIWQGLYQFPLIETLAEINENQLVSHSVFKSLFSTEVKVSLFNPLPVVHKLSHLHLHTKFWIINTQNIKNNAVLWENIEKYPVPVLIENFLKQFLN